MARHRKSKAVRVSVNPQATDRFIIGVLTGGSKYIKGLLEGTNLYDTWAEVESQLEGKPLPEYRPDQMKAALSDPNTRPLLLRAFYNPKDLTTEEKVRVSSILGNYQRVAKVDEYMIDKGEEYRNDYYENAYKSKNMQIGLSKLESQGMKSGMIKDRVAGVLSQLSYDF